jgi:GT2 family glycosyltransferase
LHKNKDKILKLSIIIVNYNVKHFLEQALLSVRRASVALETEVFVVDNNSVDDSVAMVLEKFPEVVVIANQNNPGFSMANNQAIRRAKGEYVLLLNPDTVVEENSFIACAEYMDTHLEVGGLGVKMIDGSGRFLPESKRAFPSPWVAFCKAFGLSALFPKSRVFAQYHLSYLSMNETHEIDVLSGAYMWMRKSVIDAVGLLDEAFFMYGEDIDLSYRIVKGGYKNVYFAGTTIIHYKGESTKKGSMNYVKAFYNAMIIFAKKHFVGNQAAAFIGVMQLAIYLRAGMTLLSAFIKRVFVPSLDSGLIVVGLLSMKHFWAATRFEDPDYYRTTFTYVNTPIYTILWIAGVYFSGGYDVPLSLRRIVRGVFSGTVLIAAVYGFLNMDYRTSRALIVFGAVWAAFSIVLLRYILHYIQFQNLKVSSVAEKKMVIVGSIEESERVRNLLYQAQVRKNIIGVVSPSETSDTNLFLSGLRQLDEVVYIYKIEEVIFCSKNVRSQDIMSWMTRLGSGIEYKIVPEESLSIIGSSGKNTTGELYTIDIQFRISTVVNKRNKRILDLILCFLVLVGSPVLWLLSKRKGRYWVNFWAVLVSKKTWVGYAVSDSVLPKLKSSVYAVTDNLGIKDINQPTIARLNFLYAKDWEVWKDIEVFFKALFR